MAHTHLKEKYCDVILISPPARRYSPYPPFGLLYLSSFLEENGISTRIIHSTMELGNTTLYLAHRFIRRSEKNAFFCRVIIEEILARRPCLVGLSCYTVEYHWTIEMARQIKERTGVLIVVGGVHATLKPEDFIFKGSPVDYVVLGEGETPLAKLAHSIKDGHGPTGIENIAYLSADGSPVIGVCNVERDIMSFPQPDYQKIDMRYFSKPSTRHIRNILLSGVEIFTSRGCPYNCEFCASNYLQQNSGNVPRVRYRDVNMVIEELKYLAREHGIDGFYIQDDCFLLSRERVTEFCEKLVHTGLNLVWGAETRVNLVNDQSLLQLMRKSGLLQLDFGVESGSQAMLDGIGKGITVEQIKRAFDLCKRSGIRTFANIMLNLPHEREKDIMLTEQLLDEIRPTMISVMLTVPLLGTRIYEKYVTPKFTMSEYDIYNKNVFSEISDKRFLLADHDMDFKRLSKHFQVRYNKMAGKSRLSALYWKKIGRSRQ